MTAQRKEYLNIYFYTFKYIKNGKESGILRQGQKV